MSFAYAHLWSHIRQCWDGQKDKARVSGLLLLSLFIEMIIQHVMRWRSAIMFQQRNDISSKQRHRHMTLSPPPRQKNSLHLSPFGYPRPVQGWVSPFIMGMISLLQTYCNYLAEISRLGFYLLVLYLDNYDPSCQDEALKWTEEQINAETRHHTGRIGHENFLPLACPFIPPPTQLIVSKHFDHNNSNLDEPFSMHIPE